jgi:acid phosphatase
LKDDGHDTGVAFADRWFERVFGPLMKNPQFMRGMLLVVTFDESAGNADNHIYTALYGAGVEPGSASDADYDHYSVLRTIEDTLGTGTLRQKDASAHAITGVWK